MFKLEWLEFIPELETRNELCQLMAQKKYIRTFLFTYLHHLHAVNQLRPDYVGEHLQYVYNRTKQLAFKKFKKLEQEHRAAFNQLK